MLDKYGIENFSWHYLLFNLLKNNSNFKLSKKKINKIYLS